MGFILVISKFFRYFLNKYLRRMIWDVKISLTYVYSLVLKMYKAII